MKEAGYEGCELGNKFPKDQATLTEVLRRYNLTLTTDWIGTRFTIPEHYNESLAHFRTRVEFLKPFGVEALKVCEVGHSVQQTDTPIFSHRVKFSDEQWHALLRGLNEAARIAREHGMYIAYHHHLGTGVEKQDEIERLMQSTSADDVSLLPDTGHLFAANIDPLSIFKHYASRIKYVHLKDVRRTIFDHAKSTEMCFMDAVRAGVFTVPGDGSIDFIPLFATLKAMNFSGWLVVEAEQDPKKAPPLLLAQKAREWLRHNFSC